MRAKYGIYLTPTQWTLVKRAFESAYADLNDVASDPDFDLTMRMEAGVAAGELAYIEELIDEGVDYVSS